MDCSMTAPPPKYINVNAKVSGAIVHQIVNTPADSPANVTCDAFPPNKPI